MCGRDGDIMKITSVRAFAFDPGGSYGRAENGRAGDDGRAWRDAWLVDAEVANPMSVYPRFKAHRALWRPPWGQVGCIVTADDGSWGLGATVNGAPVIAIINDHLGPLLVGEDPMQVEVLWEMMTRMISPYGANCLSSGAISAVDLALWDLKGKVLGAPVHALFGAAGDAGPIPCYATGNDTDWHMALGFGATNLACPHGPADGAEGVERNAALVAGAREIAGPETRLMLDCWMAFDVEYAVDLAARLAPHDLYWMEDCLDPNDIDAHHELRGRLPAQRLATGEHWYAVETFAYAARHGLADVFQPDICWAGGLTACRRIADVAAAHDIPVMLHAGMNTPFGQHFTRSHANAPMGECFIGSAPGIPLEDAAGWPGLPVPRDGRLTSSDAPGFGHEMTLMDIEARSGDR